MKKIATIPYIVHELRMYKAHQREKRWIVLLIITNCLWIVGAILSLVVR
jgi:hypothetical protein